MMTKLLKLTRLFFVKKRLIILDFDHTVFNTTRYVEALRRQMKERFGISEEEFMKHRDAVKQCCVVIDIDEFVRRLPYPDKQALHNLHHQILQERAATFLFDDVQAFISEHKKNFDILLLTHGNKELQTEKIAHSKLLPEVDYVISTQPKAEVLRTYVRRYQTVYFIDDKAANIDVVKTAFPAVITYFVVRPEDKPYGNIPSRCDCADFTVEGLKFVIRF